MKKTFAAILLVAVLFVTSCAADPVTLLPFIDPNGGGAVNYGGVKININAGVNSMDDDDRYWATVLGYDTNTQYGEAVLNRIADIEKNLGVTIELATEDDADIMRMKLMAGSYVSDIVSYTSFGAMQNFAQGGMLYPMTDFDHIDLSETWKYGNANVLEGGMINSIPYSVQNVAWPNNEPTGISSIVYNTELIASYGLTNPHEFWETENWYWDTFEDTYLKASVDLDDDEWMMSASEKIFWYGLMYSNDVQYVSANANGEYVVNAKPQSLIEAVQEGVDWYRDYNDKVELFSDYWTHENYDAGLAVFTVSGAGLVTDASVNVVSGLMPFPCGPSATYGIWRAAFDRIDGFGIPITSKEPDIAAHVLSELFEPLDDYLGMTLDEYYRVMLFNTEIDAEIYAELVKDVRYDYTFAGGSDLMRSVNNSFSAAIKSGKAANEAAEALANQITAIITEHALPNYDYMYKNYYSLESAD